MVPVPIADCPFQADIAFVIDDSTSITWVDERNWNPRLLGFVKALIAGFPIGSNLTRVGALTFSDFASIEFYLDEYYDEDEMQDAVDDIELSEGETNIYDGLRLMRTQIFRERNGDRPDVQNIAVVITDGQANLEAAKIEDEARQSHELGVEIFAVGVTNDTDMGQLRAIASDEDHVFTVEDFEGLYSIIDNIISTACQIITTRPTSTTTTTTTTTTTPTPTTTTLPPETTTERITTTTLSTSRGTTTTRPPPEGNLLCV